MIFYIFINMNFYAPKPTIIARFVAKRFYSRWVGKYLFCSKQLQGFNVLLDCVTRLGTGMLMCTYV